MSFIYVSHGFKFDTLYGYQVIYLNILIRLITK